MKIGVFDSGIGGLLILRALVHEMPKYDYLYLGDTKRVPYGNRSQKEIYRFLEEAVDFLFKKNCGLIVVACNTASAEALRKIQQEYLPRHYPKRRVLGVIIPTVEEALSGGKIKRIGLLATESTVRSVAYIREAKKIDPKVKIFQEAAPLLVPIIENDGAGWAEPVVRVYLRPLMQKKVGAILLGCTHYPVLKKMIQNISGVSVISQNEIIPGKLKNYLKRHPEIEKQLAKQSRYELLVTDIVPTYQRLSHQWFGKKIKLKKVVL